MFLKIRAHFAHTFASLSRYNYRLHFIGFCISSMGTWMQWVALSWYALELTGSGLQLGLVLAITFAPFLFLGSWGGLITDRFDNRTVLYVTQSLLATLSLATALLIWTHMMSLPILYALSLLAGVVTVFDEPALITLAPRLVGEGLIKNAMSLNALAFNLAKITGPMLAGVCIAAFGTPLCFVGNALSFGAVIIALLCMRAGEIYPKKIADRSPGQVREGFRYVRANPVLLSLLIGLLIVGTFTYEFQVSLPLFVRDALRGDASIVALLFSAMGTGAIVGAFASASRHKAQPKDAAWWLLLFGVSIIATSLSSIVPLALIGMLFVGLASTSLMATVGSILQSESDSAMRGRVTAMRSMAMMGTTPIGAPVIGFIGERLGGSAGLLAGGVAALVAAAVLFRRGVAEND